MNTGRRWRKRLRRKEYSKCPNCRGYGYVRILNDSDDIAEMRCPVCNGCGSVKIEEEEEDENQ